MATPLLVRPDQFRLSSYTYLYHASYGSPETDTKPVDVRSVKVSPDGRQVDLQCAGLRPGYVHELTLSPLDSITGQALRYDRAYYTLNRIPRPDSVSP